MCACWQPLEQPLSPLGPAKLCLNGFRIGLTVFPQCHVDRPHAARTGRGAAAGLVRSNQHLRAAQRIDTHVLAEVAVITNQDSGFGAIG